MLYFSMYMLNTNEGGGIGCLMQNSQKVPDGCVMAFCLMAFWVLLYTCIMENRKFSILSFQFNPHVVSFYGKNNCRF